MAGKAFFRSGLLLGAAFLCMAPVTASWAHMVHIQASEDDDDDQAGQLAQAIGCVAAYDTVLSQAHNGKVSNRSVPAIQAARNAALDFFRNDSDLPDDQVIADIAQAHQTLPSVLKESHETLADFTADCDSAFAPDPFADTVKSAL